MMMNLGQLVKANAVIVHLSWLLLTSAPLQRELAGAEAR
jgi:hypothetical protein